MESEKDLQNKENLGNTENEENALVCLIIKDLSETYVRYDVFLIFDPRCSPPILFTESGSFC